MSRTRSAEKEPLDQAELIRQVLSSRKYRNLGIPEATVRDLIQQAGVLEKDPKAIEKLVKQRMHNLVAPYLGDADYDEAAKSLDAAFASPSDEGIRNVCIHIMASHASTRERLPILAEFYRAVFAETGVPNSILDLACGLNPFALPWMSLPPSTVYHAYDIVEPRIRLINYFLRLNGRPELAETRDILVQPPEEHADVAFFFKEAHRFEQRQKHSNRAFWQSIPAKILLVSLPTANLTGSHSKLDQHRRLVYDAVEGLPWQVKELLFENEIVFCIRKNA